MSMAVAVKVEALLRRVAALEEKVAVLEAVVADKPKPKVRKMSGEAA